MGIGVECSLSTGVQRFLDLKARCPHLLADFDLLRRGALRGPRRQGFGVRTRMHLRCRFRIRGFRVRIYALLQPAKAYSVIYSVQPTLKP